MTPWWLLTLHIVGLVLWVGSLLVVTRVQAWATEQSGDVQQAAIPLIGKLMKGGAIPGLLLVLISGAWALYVLDFQPLKAAEAGPRFHIKLTLVIGLMVVSGIAKGSDVTARKRGFFGMLHGLSAALFIGIVTVFFAMR